MRIRKTSLMQGTRRPAAIAPNPGADKESNWLPAPAGDFVLMLRMYWPNETDPTILDGSWTIPAAKKVS